MQKKICMLGAFAVGKTSLIAQYVHSMFSEKYQTTVGVKIDKKVVTANGQDVTLILWDIYGEDDFMQLRTSYVRGASGYFLVADGTRADTLKVAQDLRTRVTEAVGELPFVLLINKSDLQDEWEVDEGLIQELEAQNWTIIHTSAKTGAQVEEAFATLVQEMIS